MKNKSRFAAAPHSRSLVSISSGDNTSSSAMLHGRPRTSVRGSTTRDPQRSHYGTVGEKGGDALLNSRFIR